MVVMVRPFPYFPNRRLAYHADGTRVFKKSGSEWIEFPNRALAYLNGSRRNWVSPRYQSYSLWYVDQTFKDIVFMFPEPTTITGIRVMVSGPFVRVKVSKDTTSIGDGTWADLGAFHTGRPPSPANPATGDLYLDAPQIYNPTTGTFNADLAGNTTESHDVSRYWETDWDVSPVFDPPTQNSSYGTDSWAGTGTHPLYGPEVADIVALHITPTERWLGRIVVHLYGVPAEPAGMTVVRDDGTLLAAPDLDFGDVQRDTTRIAYPYPFPAAGAGHVIGPYRIKNWSEDKTFTDVTLRLAHPIDYAMVWNYSLNEIGSAHITNHSAIKLGSGPWVWSYQNGIVWTDFHDVSIGDLGPGEVSEQFWLGFYIGQEFEEQYGYSYFEGWMSDPTLLIQAIPGGWE